MKEAGLEEIVPRVLEVNHVFDRPNGEIRARGELLRIRELPGRGILTFKGKAETRAHKSREELEIEVSNQETCQLILARLGFFEIFRYEKYRTEYQRAGEDGLVTFDETPIGTYLELEGRPEWIDDMARRLGFTHADYLTASYGALYTEFCKSKGIDPSNMVFERTP